MVLPILETQIWYALKSRIDTLVTNPAMPVYDPDAVIVPPKDVSGVPLPFILASDGRNDEDRIGISDDISGDSGTLILSVQWPLARAIEHQQLVEIGGRIAAHFPADTCMQYGGTSIRVTKRTRPLPPYVDGAYRVVVVRVFWSTQ